jgi:hypothetical protein
MVKVLSTSPAARCAIGEACSLCSRGEQYPLSNRRSTQPYARRASETFLTRVVRDGAIMLDPPMIKISIADRYDAPAVD